MFDSLVLTIVSIQTRRSRAVTVETESQGSECSLLSEGRRMGRWGPGVAMSRRGGRVGRFQERGLCGPDAIHDLFGKLMTVSVGAAVG